MKVTIERLEYFLPFRTEDGSDLATDNPEWKLQEIEQKTGIHVRHLAAPDQTAVDLAVLASERLFESGVSRGTIQATIFVTQSPDYVLPTSACIIQDRLNLPTSSLAFDINLGCSGFVYGLSTGAAMIDSGLCDNVLLLCADTYSRYIDKRDRVSRPIFSDGAAAALLSRCTKDSLGPFAFGTDGSGHRSLIVSASGARGNVAGTPRIYMDGAKVFMFTMAKVPECVLSLVAKAGLEIADIDLFVFHQASKVVLENIARRLHIPAEKVYMNLGRVGNTVSASIPIALKDAEGEGRLKIGNRVMLVGFGVGFSWGACLLDWNSSR